MSRDKHRKARQKAEREAWEREQTRLAERRRRRMLLLGASAAAIVLSVVIGLVVTFAGSESDPTVDRRPDEDVELIPEEAAREAQATAAAAAMEAGEPIADDYTVAPGKPVDSGRRPPVDDRPVACGAEAPTNVRASRPYYPGGPARVLEEGVDYVAEIQTSCGPITIDLFEDDAPESVNSFVFLAREGFYDGLEFFRDFGGVTAIQGGSGDNTVGWDIGYRLPGEPLRAEREGYPVGTVTTAGEGPYTAGSEFYIAYGSSFDSGYATDRIHTAFGRVLDGMDVIDTVTALDRIGMGGEAYAARLFMNKVTIRER